MTLSFSSQHYSTGGTHTHTHIHFLCTNNLCQTWPIRWLTNNKVNHRSVVMLISICSCNGGLLPQSGGKHHVRTTTFQLLFAASTGYAFLPHGKCMTDLWDIKPPILRAKEKVILTTSPCLVQSVGAQDTPLTDTRFKKGSSSEWPKNKAVFVHSPCAEHPGLSSWLSSSSGTQRFRN